MKVIDLLNIWVKDRNKLPEKIKIDNKVFEYDEECNLYKTPDKDCYLIQNYLDCIERLDREVEVIEKNKEIEELEISEKDRKFHSDYINNIADKLNEVIRKINKEREET